MQNAEVYIAATQRDEINMISCALARDIAHQAGKSELMTIARIHDASLISDEEHEDLTRWSGVKHAVCSDLLVIEDLKVGLQGASMVEVLPLGHDAWISIDSGISVNSSRKIVPP